MSCFQVAVLASGSKGNATVMRCEAGMVLVDAGISCRRIVQGMQKRAGDVYQKVPCSHLCQCRNLAGH